MPEVHSSVTTGQPTLLRRMFAFAGPAYLVSVGYMDPGNWATDLEGGARFGYKLLWVLVISNLMAILLQTLSARLGIVTGRDLAQACRESYPKPVSYALWVLCEIAIAACDLAEVLGAAIGLKLLFGLPLLAGVLLSAFDALAVLWLGRFGVRALEFIILAFITVIGGAFLWELFLAKPDYPQVALGLIPWLDGKSLYVAIGILGATVMPHNLYLHSSLVQTRQIAKGVAAKRSACRFNLVDSVVALNGAMVVNAAILILAGALFFKRGIIVTEIQQAHQLLAPLLGTAAASAMFAIALICSGQSSTITGTMAGQIVMEGFLNFRVQPWLRRFLTRSLAVLPAALVIYFSGEKETYKLIILSQVILSLQLPFAVIPLVQFTSDRGRMGEFANALWVENLELGRGRTDSGVEHLAGLPGDLGLAGRRRSVEAPLGNSVVPAAGSDRAAARLYRFRARHPALDASCVPRSRHRWFPSPREISCCPRSTAAFWLHSTTPNWTRWLCGMPRPWPRRTVRACTCCTWKRASSARSTANWHRHRKWNRGGSISRSCLSRSTPGESKRTSKSCTPRALRPRSSRAPSDCNPTWW